LLSNMIIEASSIQILLALISHFLSQFISPSI
jgi:hypothetical protein